MDTVKVKLFADNDHLLQSSHGFSAVDTVAKMGINLSKSKLQSSHGFSAVDTVAKMGIERDPPSLQSSHGFSAVDTLLAEKIILA